MIHVTAQVVFMALTFPIQARRSASYSDFSEEARRLFSSPRAAVGSTAHKRLMTHSAVEMRGWSKTTGTEYKKDPVLAAPKAFALAVCGVEVKTNIDRLFGPYLLSLKSVGQQEKYAQTVGRLPWAFEQIFVSTGNLQAVKKLWAMRLDGSQSETQAVYFYRCLKRSPVPVLSAVKLAGDRRVQGLVDELNADIDSTDLRSKLKKLAKTDGPARASAKAMLSIGSDR